MQLFDRKAMLERLGGDAELVTEVVQMFLEDYPAMVDEVRTAVTQGDTEQLKQAAHALKGALLNIAADSPAGLAHQLESVGPAPQPEEMRRLFTELERSVDALSVELAQQS